MPSLGDAPGARVSERRVTRPPGAAVP